MRETHPCLEAGAGPAKSPEGGLAVSAGGGGGGITRPQLLFSLLITRNCRPQLLSLLEIRLVVEERQEILEGLLIQLHGLLHLLGLVCVHGLPLIQTLLQLWRRNLVTHSAHKF